MNLVEHIKSLAERYLPETPELFLVDVVVSGGASSKRTNKVLVLIDGDEGVSIDKCAYLSRKISADLEAAEVFEGPYRLEVSSPGVDFPLKFKRQYYKHIGRRVKVQMVDGAIKIGELLEVGESTIRINEEEKEKNKVNYRETEISLNDIEKMNVLVSFK